MNFNSKSVSASYSPRHRAPPIRQSNTQIIKHFPLFAFAGVAPSEAVSLTESNLEPHRGGGCLSPRADSTSRREAASALTRRDACLTEACRCPREAWPYRSEPLFDGVGGRFVVDGKPLDYRPPKSASLLQKRNRPTSISLQKWQHSSNTDISLRKTPCFSPVLGRVGIGVSFEETKGT